MRGVLAIIARRLRAPLVLLGVVFAFSTVGLTLIPGIDEHGQPWHMSLFQALYFVTYTATTIGFGELPHPFTEGQRLFVLVIIYLSVLGWAYLLGSILSLAQDRGFQQALVGARFRRAVAGLREPFYLVCGLGESGMTVVRALDQIGCRFTAIDHDERKIQELEIEALSRSAPALAADARSPETLTAAGVLKPECRGVLALCNDDETNLAVAISACLLRPGLRVIARAQSSGVAASMASVGTYRVLNPFREFVQHIELAMRAPDTHRLLTWLTDTPGAYLARSAPPRISAPLGHWIVCGHGRFGDEVAAAVQRGGFKVTLIDTGGLHTEELQGAAGQGSSPARLSDVGVERAAGLFAGTDDDMANLAMAIAARRLNCDLYVIVRQNLQANHMLFAKFAANMTMVSTQIIANECIAILSTPLLAEFLDIVRHKDDLWAYALAENLRALVGEQTPRFWSFVIEPAQTPGLLDAMARLHGATHVADLCRRASARDARAPCIVLLLVRNGKAFELPGDDLDLAPGDQLLFAGLQAAQDDQRQVLHDPDVARHVISGHHEPPSSVGRILRRIEALIHGRTARPNDVGPR